MILDIIVIIRLYFKVCLLECAPQDVPGSWVLLVPTVGVYLIIAFLVTNLNAAVTDTPLVGLIDVGFLFGFVYALLSICRKPSRWTQTVTALAGCGIIIGALSIPLLIAKSDPASTAFMGQITTILQYALMIWYMVVMAHIFRHAVAASFATGLFLSLLYAVLLQGLINFSVMPPSV